MSLMFEGERARRWRDAPFRYASQAVFFLPVRAAVTQPAVCTDASMVTVIVSVMCVTALTSRGRQIRDAGRARNVYMKCSVQVRLLSLGALCTCTGA
jgi:hypothetical protein